MCHDLRQAAVTDTEGRMLTCLWSFLWVSPEAAAGVAGIGSPPHRRTPVAVWQDYSVQPSWHCGVWFQVLVLCCGMANFH